MEKIHGEELILGFTLRVLPQFGHGLCVCDPTWWWANVQVKCMTVYAPLPPKLRRCSLIVSAGYSMRKKSRQRRVSKWQNWAGTSVFCLFQDIAIQTPFLTKRFHLSAVNSGPWRSRPVKDHPAKLLQSVVLMVEWPVHPYFTLWWLFQSWNPYNPWPVYFDSWWFTILKISWCSIVCNPLNYPIDWGMLFCFPTGKHFRLWNDLQPAAQGPWSGWNEMVQENRFAKAWIWVFKKLFDASCMFPFFKSIPKR